MKKPIVMSYSGGKDSSYALYNLKKSEEWEVTHLLTTANSVHQRSSMHGIRTALAQKQAEAIGLPLDIVWLEPTDGGTEYAEKMTQALESYKENGIQTIAFGDLFLEDIRAFRETMNASLGLASQFPIWGVPTKELAYSFIKEGFKAIVVCVDTTQLDASFCGREFNESFLNDLPEGIDWCAENGEFHTFCYDGPIFKTPIPFKKGQQILRDDRFQYIDLIEMD
jgi:uncharacterized protein (TIGR00290 family)